MTTRVQNALPTAAWHTLTTNETLAQLQTTAGGLSSAQVTERQQQYGPNSIAAAGGSKVWTLVLHQFTSPLIYVLLLVMVITAGLQHWADTIVIGAVVLLNAVVGFTQEYRAEHAMQALMQMMAARATVRRDGRREAVDSQTLVPGDIIFLESGDLVPADVRLLQTTHLEVDEALLTGESLPVAKTIEVLPAGQRLALGDQRNMAFMGSAVTAGRGLGVVVATGLQTQMGSIAGEMRRTTRAETPLQTRMMQFGRWISVAILGASAVVFVIGVFSGLSWVEMFLTAVALAVAAIPEGLPVAMTVALAVGVNRMARRNAIIRRLVAVETLGSCTVIVTDKTGTLTENHMTVQAIWTPAVQYAVSGPGRSLEGAIVQGAHQVQPWEGSALHYTLLGGVLDNEAGIKVGDHALSAYGDPTEVALLVAGAKAGMLQEPQRQRWQDGRATRDSARLPGKAQFYLDFIEAENSRGFHAPREAARILAASIDFSRQGQAALRVLQ
jgi:magnesium-transporting ATPase (P-type)